MTPREREIRDWAAGSYPDGKPHIPDGCESFTRDLLVIIDGMRARLDEHQEVLEDRITASLAVPQNERKRMPIVKHTPPPPSRCLSG